MSSSGLKVQGKVLLGATLQALAGHRVDVVQGQGAGASVVATGQTDVAGGFAIDVPTDVVQALLASGGDGLSVRVYDPCDALVADTVDKGRWSPANAGEAVRVRVGPGADDPCCRAGAAPEDAPAVVRGAVRYEDGNAAGGLVVRARHRALGEEHELGVAKVDDKGNYFIRYAPPTAGGRRLPVALVLRVEQPDGALKMATGVIEDAPAELEANLTLKGRKPGAAPEFTDVAARLGVALGATPLRSLPARDLALLAGRVGVAPDKVAAAAAADRFVDRASKHGVALENAHVYALVRSGLSRRFHELVTARADQIAAALGDAVKDGTVAPLNAGAQAAVAALIRQAGVKESLVDPDTAQPTPFGGVLAMALAASAEREAFVARWYDGRDDPAQFWAALAAEEPYASTGGLLESVKFHLQLGVLTGYRAPVVTALKALPGVTSFAPLARLSQSEWVAALSGVGSPESWLPEGLPGESNGDRIAAWARELRRAAEVAYPTEAVKGELQRALSAPSPAPTLTHVVSFLEAPVNASFELDRTQVDLYLAAKGPTALADVPEADRVEVVEQLKAMQRVYRIAPEAGAMGVHMAAGFRSADDVVGAGFEGYALVVAPIVGDEAAHRFYDNAVRVQAAGAALHASLSTRGATPYVMESGEEEVNATLPDLFGPLSACACEHCRSVFSPAAYFTQVLQYLRRLSRPATPTAGAQNGLDVLVRVRPDLAKIGLCCANSDTPMPYVDLVNEVLEAQVPPTFRAEPSSPGGDLDPAATGPTPISPIVPGVTTLPPGSPEAAFTPVLTEGTAGERAALPQHTWYPAYRTLAKTDRLHPFDLPFEQPREEARAYLRHLGVDAASLRTVFARQFLSSEEQDAARWAVAAERLGLVTADRSLLTGAFLEGALADAWGAAPGAGAPSSYLAQVYRADRLLDRAGLTLDAFRSLESSRFLRLRFAAPRFNHGFPCKLDELTWDLVQGDPEATVSGDAPRNLFLDGLQRMLRLSARTGWTLLEVDQALSNLMDPAVLSPTIQVAELELLAEIDGVARDLKVSRMQALGLWGPIDARRRYDGSRSVFEETFLDPAVRNPVDPVLLALSRGEPAPTGATFATCKEAILVGLQIPAADLERVLAFLYPTEGTGRAIDLVSLGGVLGHVLVARAVGLRVAELVDLVGMGAPGPAFERHPTKTRAFLDVCAELRRAGLSTTDVKDLLRGVREDGSSITPDARTAKGILQELQAALRGVYEDTIGEPTALPAAPALVEGRLAAFLTAAEASAVVAAIMTPPAGEAAQEAPRRLLLSVMWPGEVTALFEAGDAVRPQKAFEALLRLDTLPTDRSLARLREALLALLDAPTADAVIDLVEKDVALPPMAISAVASALGVFATDLAPSAEIAPLAPEPSAFTARQRELLRGGRTALLLGAALRARRERRCRDVLTEKLAPFFQLDSATMGALLHPGMPPTFVLLPGTEAEPAAKAWTSPTFVLGPPPGDDPSALAFRALMRVARAVAIVRRGRLDLQGLSRYVAGAVGTNAWMPLNALPSAAGEGADASFDGLRRTLALFDLQRRIPAHRAGLFDLVEAARPDLPPAPAPASPYAQFIAWFAPRAGVSAATLQGLLPAAAGPSLGNEPVVAFQEDVGMTVPSARGATVAQLHRLFDALDALKRLGITPTEARAWTAPLPSDLGASFTAWMRVAASVRGFLRAKYDARQWAGLAKPLFDGLRERQRKALVGWLFTTLRHASPATVRTVDDLYGHFLLDVETTPATTTSRLRQAIASVQLFVQRALMNVERDEARKLVLDPAFPRRWKWARRYRVWEANRKVFYYPENWIEPELRLDKSPFFRELEGELMQQDLTDENAERAVRRYLERLDEVGRLDVLALHRQVGEAGAPDVLHVFARTAGQPHAHFYRSRAGSTWGAWEQLELDIPSDHLLPIVMNRRLYLFWPEFAEKEKQDQAFNTAATSTPTVQKRLGFKMAWSRREGASWSPKKLSRMADVVLPDSVAAAKDVLFKVGRSSEGAVEVTAYHSLVAPNSLERSITLRFNGCTQDFEQDRALAGAREYSVLHWGRAVEGQVVVDAARYPMILPFRGDVFATVFERSTAEWRWAYLPPTGVADFNAARDPVFVTTTERRFAGTAQTFAGGRAGLFLVEPAPTPPRDAAADPAADRLSVQYYACLEPAQTAASGELTPFAPRVTLGGAKVSIEIKEGENNPAEVVGLGQAAPGEGVPADPAGALFGHEAEATGGPRVGLRLRTRGALKVTAFYHPRVCDFIQRLDADGFEGLYRLTGQLAEADEFAVVYRPERDVVYHEEDAEGRAYGYPREGVSFGDDDPYSLYNWELFFHIPFLVASQLHKNQRFEEALRWLHFVFNPTIGPTDDEGLSDSSTARFWRFAPFHLAERGLRADEIASLMATDAGALTPRLRALQAEFLRQLERLEESPFDPHTVARTRTRAYQLAVVMRYIDALIDWGDSLFRQDTMESVQEATQLYLLAAGILGKRPVTMPERDAPTKSYGQLHAAMDRSGNALAQTEQALNAFTTCWHPRGDDSALASLSSPTYFCVPPNEKLLGYWDRVADRLFKIRHSLNIEGVRRELALYEPPIDPAVLVRARAAGVDLGSLADGPVGGAHYRFLPLLQRAVEFTGDVRSLGGQLLAALEKRDAEALSNLRTVHERSMAERVREVRRAQVEEATRSKEALERSKALAEARKKFYDDRVRQPVSGREETAADLHESAIWTQLGAQVLSLLGAALAPIPDPQVGVVGFFPMAAANLPGGVKLSQALHAASSAASAVAGVLSGKSSAVATQASYDRRLEEWRHQAAQAELELTQLDKQIAAADVRVAIARRELENHEQQIENAREVEEFLRDKFTNEALYDWMARQVASLYFESYRLAFDLARKAERAYQFERLAPEARFVQFGHWDNLKRGLLAGERLHLDLRRMEHAYLEQNRRDLEMTKHVSLAMTSPESLLALKRTGRCAFAVPEALFDLDYPGHYMRRIKAVSMTIPAVVGPYAGVHATLTLTKSAVRRSSLPGADYGRAGDADPRFVVQRGAVESICTSSGQNDGGVFQLDFRDERYLPFEGAGADSEWALTLRARDNDFDLSTLTDVILHVQYTARDGGEALRKAAEEDREADGNDPRPEYRVFSARQHFPTAWQAFTTSLTAEATQVDLTLEGLDARLPAAPADGEVVVTQVMALPVLGAGTTPVEPSLTLRRPTTPSGTTDTPMTRETAAPLTGLYRATFLVGVPAPGEAAWSLRVAAGEALAPDGAARPVDIVVVVKTERRLPVGD